MSVTIEPYSEIPPLNADGACHAYVRVRVVNSRPNGQWLVYLSDGTGIIVPGRYLLRIDPDPSDPSVFRNSENKEASSDDRSCGKPGQ